MPYFCNFTKKSAVAHLRDCLKLQNNTECLNVLRNNILGIGKKHLDPFIPASQQKSALKALREELKELYPDVFSDEESESRLYIAVQIVMRDHRSKRQNLKKKENKAGPAPQEKAGTPASKSASGKHHIRRSLPSPKQNSGEQHIHQALFDATKHATDKPYDKRRKTPTCYQQDKNQAPMQFTMHATAKASETRSANIVPHTGRLPSAPMQLSNEQDEDQFPTLVTNKCFDDKTTKILNIRHLPSASMQSFDEHDEDHVPLDVTMHEMDTVSDRRSLPAPSQRSDEQRGNRVTLATDKASGKRTKKIFDNRCSFPTPTREQDDDQVPMNLTMYTMNKISDRMKAKILHSERTALSPTLIANTPSAPNMTGIPSLRVHASQSSRGVSTPFSQSRSRVLFTPHISNSQLELNQTPSQPRSTLDNPCSQYSSISMSHPITCSTSADAPIDPSTSKDSPEGSPKHESAVPQDDKFTSVYHFLEACVPSMGYLLPHFVEYGCTHERFLLVVSRWPPEKIKKFLEDVVTSPDGQLISPMERMVLENHLTQYFKA